MKTKKCWRHGEILFVETQEVPKEAKIKKTNNLLIGSHGNPHTFKGGKFYELNKDYIFGYLEAKNTTLHHSEHGEGKGELKSCQLPDGIYELRKGQEFINDELKPIVD